VNDPHVPSTRLASALQLFALLLAPSSALAQQISNDAFQIQYDESGLRSLRRTNDIHDTDYIAQNGASDGSSCAIAPR